MARTCQADDALEKQFETLLKHQAGPEVGLLVGKHGTGAKTHLYGTIKTPSQDGFDPIAVTGVSVGSGGARSKAGKKAGGSSGRAGGSGAPSGGVVVNLEVEWITEHARQVARMLPGGLSVLGLYVFCPDAAYTAAATQLCGLLAGLASFCLPPRHPAASAAATAAAGGAGGSDEQQHLLLLHIDASSRRQALRALPVSAGAAAAAASLRPVELRFAPILGSLVLLRCWHGLDLALPVAAAAGGRVCSGVGGGGDFAGAAAAAGRGGGGFVQLAALVAAEAERIRRGVFVAGDGDTLPPDSAPVGEALSASGSNSGSTSGFGSSPGAVVLNVPTFDLSFLAPPLCQQLHPAPHYHHHYEHQRREQQQQEQGQQSQQQQDSAGAGGCSPEGGGGMVVVGQARLRGCIRGLALVNRRDLVGRAVAELKADLLSSINTRLELLIEDATRVSEQQHQEHQHQLQEGGESGSASGGTLQQPLVQHPLFSSAAQLTCAGGCWLPLPRRVVLPWLGGALALCDYLLEGELAEAAAERVAELLALQDSQVLQYELPASAAASGPWRPNVVPGKELPAGKAQTKAGTSGATSSGSLVSGLSCGGTVLASLAVAAVASAVGMMSLMGQQTNQ